VRWADLEAQEMLRDKGNDNDVTPRPFGSAIERRRWLRESVYWRAPMFVRCFAYWFYRYFVRLGFLDGKEGLIFHFLQGLWFRLLIDARLLELNRSRTAAVITTMPAPAGSPQQNLVLARDAPMKERAQGSTS